ncbi:hypothetical protein [Calidithermus timidus]|uniref:hypothetical protein n=1 Tax=Calidithermus timidus TaxID=307124 RepID=UPI000368D2C7|nr:hypothetical protein [Calidithermus timidus]
MKQSSTLEKQAVLSREEAVSAAAFQLAEAREKAAVLYGWLLAGEADSHVTPALLAGIILEALQRAHGLASAFAPVEGYNEAVLAFLEEARREAARRIALRVGEGVPL